MAVGGKVNFEVDDGTFIGQRENCDMCITREHEGYCSQCEIYICQICFDNHLKLKSCRNHMLLQDSHEIKTHDSAIRFETCDEHKQQEVKAYCTEHKCCVCIECILLDHKSCEWEYIIDASNRFQDSGDLARMLEKVQSLEYTLDKCMETIDKHTITAERINKDVVSNIESFTKSLVEYVAGSKQQVLDDAKVRAAAHQHKIDKLKVDIQSLGLQVEEIITDFRDEDMLHKRFILAVETLPKVARIEDELASIDCNNVVNDYTFRPSNFLKRMMSNTRPIGRLTDVSHTEEDEDDDEDVNLKKERERSEGLVQQLEDNKNTILKLNEDLADTKQNDDSQQMGQVFPPGGGAGYFVPTMTPAEARVIYYAPTHIPQMRAGPRWQTVRPGQPCSGFQSMQGGAVRPGTRPTGAPNAGAPTGQQQVRPTSMNARPITGQSAPARPGMPMPQSSMAGRPQQPQAPTMPQATRPGYSPFNNRPQQSQAIHVPGQDALTASMLAAAPPQEQKQMLGGRLFPLISRMYPDLAGKITGMLLDINISELLHMLESTESLKAKVEEAVVVLQAHQAKEATANQTEGNAMKKD